MDFININEIDGLSKKERAELASIIEKYTRYQKLGDHQKYGPIATSVMEHLKGLTNPERLASFHKRIADFFGFMITKIKYTRSIEKHGLDKSWKYGPRSWFLQRVH